jgi:hypothetical protein
MAASAAFFDLDRTLLRRSSIVFANAPYGCAVLITHDPAAARRMCLLLADFLRETLRLGGNEGDAHAGHEHRRQRVELLGVGERRVEGPAQGRDQMEDLKKIFEQVVLRGSFVGTHDDLAALETMQAVAPVVGLMQARTHDGDDPTHQHLSLLATGPDGWSQLANFTLMGLLVIAVAALTSQQPPDRRARSNQ